MIVPSLRISEQPAVVAARERLSGVEQELASARAALSAAKAEHAEVAEDVLRAEALVDIGEGDRTRVQAGRDRLVKLNRRLDEADQLVRRRQYASELLQERLAAAEDEAAGEIWRRAHSEMQERVAVLHKALRAAAEANDAVGELHQACLRAQVRPPHKPLAWESLRGSPRQHDGERAASWTGEHLSRLGGPSSLEAWEQEVRRAGYVLED